MKVAIAFQLQPIEVALEKLLPTKKFPSQLLHTVKYSQIRASIREVDVIEPLSVTEADPSGMHHVLDGHMRLAALRELSRNAAPCLIAKDDETYTYNNRVNKINAIQEHYMIRRALDRGVSAERLALALNVNVHSITAKSTLLDGISPEAVRAIEDRHFSPSVARVLRKMKPVRQMECVDLMTGANNLTVTYAQALLLATPEDALVVPKKGPKAIGPDQVAAMEREMANVHEQYRLAEETYSDDMMQLVLARGYMTKLIANEAVFKYLQATHAEVLEHLSGVLKSGDDRRP